ncbi:hypothetical protein B0H17DRAFT_1185905 [Mycena rosella]|uniref:Uncharacterized protein n=1 Tax=Mycena rosella TaxID=1033263 RepID=A0AAD7CPC2_MYCRO|nr:hypothetical protein B0H17DRAFT_1185905 [Mycena rosella]
MSVSGDLSAAVCDPIVPSDLREVAIVTINNQMMITDKTPDNHRIPSAFMAPSSTSEPKGTWGGHHKNSGRKAKDSALGSTSVQGQFPVPSQATLRRRASVPQKASSSRSGGSTVKPAAFFLPYNTNHPIPRGSFAVPSVQTSSTTRTSLWSTVGTSRSGTTANTPPNSATDHMRNMECAEISPNEFLQLNNHLDYIEENDEHADIAAGDRILDESLADEVLESTEANAETAEAETRCSEAHVNTVLHRQLSAARDNFLLKSTPMAVLCAICVEISMTDLHTQSLHFSAAKIPPGLIRVSCTGIKYLYGSRICYQGAHPGSGVPWESSVSKRYV